MKKECIALSLSLCMLLSACSRQPDPRYADYTQSDLLELEEHSLFPFGEDMCLCGHREGYHSIHFALDEFTGNGKTAEDFISEKNSDSEDFNIVEFVKFADISKESYKAYIDKYYPSDSVELADMEIIYCGDETKINNYFNFNIQSHSEENETEPAKNFFVIHGALIRHVGEEKYKEYLTHVLGTKYDNVVSFIRHFEIDKGTFVEIMAEAEDLDFYIIDELY